MLRSIALALSTSVVMALCPAPALAESGANDVSVDVLGVNCTALPPKTDLLLSPAPTDPTSRLIGSADHTDALVLSHNGADGLRLTITAAADLLNLPNDISLSLSLAGLSPQICVDHGVPLADLAMPTALPPGGDVSDLSWTADASRMATKSGSYAWTITITSTDL